MNKVKQMILAVVMAGSILSVAGQAMASDFCTAPESQWKTKEALIAKLEKQGWTIRRIKVEDGCYEAYATDENGNRVEAYFDPSTLAKVKGKSDD